MASFAAARLIKERHARQILKKSGVYGVGVGLADPNSPKKGAAVIIYSDRLAATSTGIPAKLTAHAKGKRVSAPVRFVGTGQFKVHANYTGRIRPVVAGYSIGTTDRSGTVGLIMQNSGSQRYIFSNNHVLNPTNSAAFQATLQPGGADNGRLPRDRVGRLFRFVRLVRGANNYVDGAIAIPTVNQLLSARYAKVGVVPGHVTAYRIGERFKKVGRTTGLVTGTVQSIHTDLQIDYGGSLGILNFKDQTVVRGTRPVSLAGDSGSVWLRSRDNFAAAVNYAGSPDGLLSIAYPVRWALQAFGTRVARPTGRTGAVKQPAAARSGAYTRPLPAKTLARLRIGTARGR